MGKAEARRAPESADCSGIYHEAPANRTVSLFYLRRKSLSARDGPSLPAAPRPPPAMIESVTQAIEQARLAARALVEFGGHLFDPTVRLGVTGLSRAGKTVFITALVQGLMRGGRFPVFEALGSGRIAGEPTGHR